ncbi:SMI1/KNR4 family protein [Clostridium tarantellae]|uniref:SMI1/KNR4 family protein n=1 Tax=Clostridium tarantellae TaxID=39493 RepID=A0A6I1MWT7_9CLOT|nr:SMI1/KNR4 family protein [Clostridium tarantellae]MPQ44619.1 SMI1/KNR4 family protein [Clostridium tarantellae]
MTLDNNTIIYPLPTDKLLNDEEKIWGIILPESYKTFIKTYNGAIPIEKVFSSCNDSYVIDRFLCILEKIKDKDLEKYDVDAVLIKNEENLTKNQCLIGIELLPIALLSGLDLLCLDYRNCNDIPKICVWKNEESTLFNPITEYVSDSISDFLNGECSKNII